MSYISNDFKFLSLDLLLDNILDGSRAPYTETLKVCSCKFKMFSRPSMAE